MDRVSISSLTSATIFPLHYSPKATRGASERRQYTIFLGSGAARCAPRLHFANCQAYSLIACKQSLNLDLAHAVEIFRNKALPDHKTETTRLRLDGSLRRCGLAKGFFHVAQSSCSDLKPQIDRGAAFAIGALVVILASSDLLEPLPAIELQRGLIVVSDLQKDESGAAALEILQVLF